MGCRRRFRDLATHQVAPHLDVRDIGVEGLDDSEDLVSAMGFRGIGKIGIVITSAAVTDALYHATGRPGSRAAGHSGGVAAQPGARTIVG